MLTPQEVSERAFAKASFGGYNMAMVDEFLDALTEDYTALYKENAALKAKMKVLVDKVEEYRATDDAMRKTLLAAQTMADEMVRDAERKKNELLAQAEGEAREQLAAIRQELVNEQARLTAAQNATALCLAKAKELYQRELAHLDSLADLTVPQAGVPQTAAPKAEPAPADPVAAAVAEIESNMNRMMEEEAAAEPETAPVTEEEEDTLSFQPVPDRDEEEDGEEETSTRRLDLSDLRFGKDFDLK